MRYGKILFLGRVRSKDRIVITPKTPYFKNGKGNYLFVGLHVNNLVAQNFIQNPHNYKQVNHINENKKDNRADNLEWCTAEYNMNYGTAMQRAKETYASHYDRGAIAKIMLLKRKLYNIHLMASILKNGIL